MNEEYFKGYDAIKARLSDLLYGDWTYFGIFDFDFTYIKDKHLIVPENIALAVADLLLKKEYNVLVLMNYNRPGMFPLIDPVHLDSLKRLVSSRENYHLFSLSVDDLAIPEKLKANVTNIIELKEILSKIFANLSERTNYISPKKIKATSVLGLSKFLIDMMGPPNIRDDLRKRAQNVIAQKGGTTKFAASLVSVPRLIEYSLMGLSGLWKVIKMHRSDPEYKEYLAKLEAQAKELYNIEKLSIILSEEYTAFKEGINIVVTDCFKKEYGFVIPLLILDFLKQFQNAVVILVDIPDPEHYAPFIEWLPDIIEGYENKLVSYLATKYVPTTESYNEYIKRLMNDKSTIFNLKADFFHFLHSGESIVVYSWLYDKFGQIEEERRDKEYLFIVHDTHREDTWELMNVTKGSIERLKGFFSRRE